MNINLWKTSLDVHHTGVYTEDNMRGFIEKHEGLRVFR